MSLRVIVFLILIATSIILDFDMPKKIIDQIQIVTVVGYDYIDEDTIQGTVVSPFFLQKGAIEDLVYTGTSSSIYENREKLNAQTSEEMYNGKIEVAFFNTELARHGLKDQLDYLLRDPSIGTRMFLGIAKESAHKLLTSVKSKKGTGIFLSDTIEHNIRNGILPQTNLKQFAYGVETKTIDPFLPLFSIKDGTPSIAGLALFQNDKLVDTIPYNQAFTFKMLYEEVGDGQYDMNKNEYKVSVHNMESTRDVHVKKRKGEVSVTINIEFIGVVREYTGKNLTKNIKKIQKDLEKDFKKNAKKLIKKFKEQNIDPLGIEAHVKSQIRSYNKKKFKDQYKDIPVHIKIKFRLTETGTRR